MLISHWLKSLRSRLHRSVRPRVSKKRRTQRIAPKNVSVAVESLEDRMLLAGAGPQLISIFPNAGITQPEDTGGRLQPNEVLETAPRELVFRFNPGQIIDPASLTDGNRDGIFDGIQVYRSGFDNDFNNGSVPVPLGSLQIGDQPNEVILRFASPLPDDQYQILLKGTGSNPLRNTMQMPFNNGIDQSFFFEVDLGGHIEAVVHEPIVRSQILTVDNVTNLTDGVTFTVKAGGKPIRFEFDRNGVSSADGDNVFAINIASATSTTQFATQIGLALQNAAAVHGPAFGLEAVQGSLPNSIVISASASTTFSPTISVAVNGAGAPVTGITLADGGIQQRENFVNVFFNANDPLNAVGRETLVVPAAASNGAFVIKDGDQFTATNNGSPVIFTMDSGPAGRFNVILSTGAVVRDGDFIVLDGQRFEFNTGPVLQVAATNVSEMVIGGTFTLTDNSAPTTKTITFEFTNGNPVVTTGNIGIDLAGATSRADIVNRIVLAINGQSVNGFTVSASALNNGSGRITLVNDTSLAISAGQPNFIQSGNYGVTAGTGVAVEENFTSTQLAQALSNAVNGTANRGFNGGLVNFPTFTTLTNASFFNPTIFTNLNLTGNSGPLSINYYAGDSAGKIAASIAAAVSSQAGLNATARSGVVKDGWVVQLDNGSFAVPATDSPFVTYTASNPTTVESPAFYKLTNTDGTFRLPDEVIYNADAGVATLRFNTPFRDGTFTLTIGESVEATNTLATTVNLGTRFGSVTTTLNDFIGGNPTSNTLDPNDIDLYRFEILTPTTAQGINISLSSRNGLDAAVRLFDATGAQIGATLFANNNAATAFFPPTGILPAGVYFVGVSSQGNISYSALDGSGAAGGGTTGSYRLAITPNVAVVPTNDDNSSFDTATNLGNLGTAGQVVSAQIQPQNAVFNLPLPLEPGGNDEPGHRDIPVGGENHIANGGIGRGTDIAFPNGVPTIAFTFDLANPYGFDPQGNALFNAITVEQRQRTREIFELYSYVTGVQFVETLSRAEASAQGLGSFTVVTGDLRALDPTVPTGPGGVGGIAGGGLAIVDAGENFTAADNLYGQSWFRIAMHEIGHLLGLAHSLDIPAIMGLGIGNDTAFPGDNDIVHIRRLFRRDGNDVDMYQFNVSEAGMVSIETLAERFPLPEQASQLNTIIRLYRLEPNGERTLIAQNDDYYGNDSFLSMRLERGTYFIGISSVGNDDYDPSVSNSGSTGITEGRYELRIDLLPDLEPIPDDPSSVLPQNVTAKGRSVIHDVDASLQFDGFARKATAFDGDGDGRSGGQQSFSFQVGDTIFVDKQAANYPRTGPLGSATNPYLEIDQALVAANARRMANVSMNPPIPTPVIVRIVGNSGADGQLGTLGDNLPYLLGIPLPGQPVLPDGFSLEVPRDINVVIDAGAVFKIRDANLDAGSSAQGINRRGGSLQLLGTTFNDVILTSFHDDTIGGDSDGVFTLGANPGDWGGIVFRGDSDYDFEYSSTQTKTNIFATNGGVANPSNPFRYTFTGFPIPATDATLSFLAFGDFSDLNENLTIQFVNSAGVVIAGSPSFTLFDGGIGGVGLDATSISAQITLTKDQFNLVSSDGSLRVRVTASAAVDNINVIESLRVDLSVGTAVPVYLNTVNHATILYSGGPVVVDSISRDFDAIHLIDARPTISYNTIARGGNAAISGNPDSFNDTFEDPRRYDHHLDRLGPDIHGNSVFSNEINGVRIRTELQGGVPLEKLQVPARFTATDIVYVITENLVIDGSPGGLIVDRGSDPNITSDDVITKRTPGRLRIDPGVIVKLAGARIELERGGSNLIAEGTPEDPIIFTSINDDSIGAGGSFDTNNDSLPQRLPPGVPGGFTPVAPSALHPGGGGNTNAVGGPPPALGTPLSPEVIAAATVSFHGADGVGKDGVLARLGWSLNLLYQDHQAYLAGGSVGNYVPSLPYIRTYGQNIVVDLSAATANLNALRSEIQGRGYQILAEAGSTIGVLIPITALADLVTLQNLRVVSPVFNPISQVGSTTSQGDVALNSDDVRATLGFNGQGITVGVLSDSFDTSGMGSYLTDIASGDLPGPGNSLGNTTPISVIQDFPNGSDEGRAMLQLIHDVAPGAALQFAEAFTSQAVFAANIRNLRDAGSDVIVDDIGYADEPFFQDGIVAQAVDEVVGDGVAYFSAAGNDARDSYESAFVNSGVAGPGGQGTFHDFDPGAGVDTFQQITVDPFGLARFSFQWDQPFGSLGGASSASDVDFLFFDLAGNLLTGGNVLQGQDANIGGDAFEFAGIINPTGAPLVVNVAILLSSGPAPGIVKYISFGGGFTIDEFQTNSSTSFGHANAAGAEAVGAAFYQETPEFGASPPLLESFSSAGGINILFDTAGNRLAAPEVRQTVDITAPDGTNTTFFGFDADSDGFPNFFGTSAAAPHAAAVAALMLQAAGGSGSLTPSQINGILESTAIDMGISGYDNDSGFGLINALPAVTQAQSGGGGGGPVLPVGQQPAAGDWSGLIFNAASQGNFDYVQIRYGGGSSPIAGGFAGFNTVEIVEADVRISNSLFENNSDGIDPGTTSQNRIGRGANVDATIFVRGAQPVIVSNIFEDNESNVISINANAMQAVVQGDPGRATGLDRAPGDPAFGLFSRPLFASDDPNFTTQYANNFGPLVRNNRMVDNGFNGMEVRGGELTTETVWDDTDIVHILRDEIIVPNLHTFGGLRLQSSTTESLVVKLVGPNAGFTAGGTEVDIDDRVGGTLEILGTPGRPVVLTSLYDGTVGAGFQPNGLPLLDTVAPGARQPAPGDWRSVRLDQFSNDRNVAVYNERERATRLATDVNNIPNIPPNGAEPLGILAANQAAADDNRRAGYEIHGFINTDDPTDQDVYSFIADAGTEVWFDIDRTAGSLDTVLELIDASGTVLFARSNDSQAEQNDPTLIDRGVDPARIDPLTGLPMEVIAEPLRKDDRDGEDFYSTNPKDAGMRVILPGIGTGLTYFIRVRSNGPSIATATDTEPGTVDGLTSGEYQLQIRLQQRDEHPGSTVTFSQIRYATNGIEVFGQPSHGALIGESGEGAGNNDSQGAADNIGNVIDSDLTTFGVTGNLASMGDVDFYQFNITYQGIQQIAGVNSPADEANGFPLIFDLDYADGLARANASIFVFNNQGQLVLVGSDSNIADDQPLPLSGNGLLDPTRGTVGKLDPFIGSIELPEGTYFAVVTANANMPAVLNQYVTSAVPANIALTRLEPVDSINRIAEDHIGNQGGMTFQTAPLTTLIDTTDPNPRNQPQVLTSSIVPWHLGDVSLFVSQGSTSTNYYTVDPFTGALETRLNNAGTLVRDLAIRRRDDRNGGNNFSGDLVAFQYNNQGLDQSNFLTIDSGNGTTISSVNDGIDTYTIVNGAIVVDDQGINFNALTYSDGTSASPGIENGANTMIYAVGTQFGDRAGTPRGQALPNVLYRITLNGTGTSAPGGNRTPQVAVVTPAYTDVVERGILDTTTGGAGSNVLIIPDGATVAATGTGDNSNFRVVSGGVFDFQLDAGPSLRFNPNFNTTYIVDGDKFDIDGTTYEYDTGTVILITALNRNQLNDGDTFTILDPNSVNRVFEIDTDGNFVAGTGRIRVDLTAANDNSAITNVITNAINNSGIGVTATRLAGPLGNSNRISLIGDQGVSTTGVSGVTQFGSAGVAAGNTRIQVEEISTGAEIATNTAAVVNAADMGRGAFNNTVNFPRLNTLSNIVLNNAVPGRAGIITNLNTTGGAPVGVNAVDYFFSDNTSQIASQIATAINNVVGANTATASVTTVVLNNPGDTFDSANTSQPPFTITGGAPGGTITGIATLGGTLYAITDAGGLFTIQGVTGRNASVSYVNTATDLVGLNFQGLTAGPPNVEGGRYANMLFGITANGTLLAFNTSGVLQPIFLDGATSVATGLTNVTGLEFSNLDENLWHAETDRQTDAGHGINPVVNDSIHFPSPTSTRAQQGGTSLYFGNDYANGDAENSIGGLAGGTHGTIETNSFSLEGYSADDQPTLYFNYFLESQLRDVLLNNPQQMLDSMRVHVWDSSTGQWDLLVTNNSARSTTLTDEYDYQLPPGVADDRYIQEGFNFDEAAGQWRQIRVNLSPYAGLADLKLRFDFSADGSMNLGDTFTTGTELRGVAGSRLQDGQTFTIDGVTFEFDLGFTVNVPSGGHFSDRPADADTVSVTGTNGITKVFEFDNDNILRVPGSTRIAAAPNDSANTIALRLATAINAAGIAGVTAIVNGDRVNITAGGAGAPFNVQVSSATGNPIPAPQGLYLDEFDGAGVSGGNVQVIVDASMSSTEVAGFMRQAIADVFDQNATGVGTGDIRLYKIYRDVIRIIGHNVTGQSRVRVGGALEVARGLQGDEFGRFYQDEGLIFGQSTTRRLTNYNFEGLYIDDIIIGFAERGEIATGAPTGTSNFISNPSSNTNDTLPTNDISVGNYQLEIRRGSEYSMLPLNTGYFQTGVLDTNDRLSSQLTIVIPDGSQLFDGQTFQLSDGRHTATFEFADLDLIVGDANFGIQPGTLDLPNYAVGFRATESSAVIAARLRDLLNSTAVRNYLNLTAAMAEGSVNGNQGRSSEVNIFGSVTANVRGDLGTGVGNGFGAPIMLQPLNFTLTPDPNINDLNNQDVSQVIPHVSITRSGTGLFHYYSFTANAGDTAIFDIDAANFDSELFLYDLAGNLLATNDDGGFDVGSLRADDAFLQFTFTTAGTYVIGVGEFNSTGSQGGITGNPPDSGDNYTLHVSVQNPGPVSRSPITSSFNLIGSLQFEFFGSLANEFPFIGDSNLDRRQGSIQIAQNFIFDTLLVGIRIDDNIRRVGNQPLVGVPRVLPVANNERLTRGVKIVNNVIGFFGDAGIVLNGVASVPNEPVAAVPFHRVINNTIYGGATQTGDGIRVSNNVAPTLLNNIIANTTTSINNATAGNNIVVARSSYQNNGFNPIGGVNAQFLFTGAALFVDPSTRNFYLAAGAQPIDSARNQFEDRDPIVQVAASIGIPASNLFAPLFDAFGQFRTNDENTPNTGEGNPPFFDRGAIEREDIAGPTATLIAPEDNDGLGDDLDPDLTEVFLVNKVIRQFIIGLDDVGIGIDDTSVNTTNVQLDFNGLRLTAGVDYLFRYNANTKQITLDAASGVFAFGDYHINLVNMNGIRDLAGNSLLANRQPAGTTAFDITIAPPPVVSIQNVSVTEGDSGTKLATFTVSLSGPTQTQIDFTYQTFDGTATSSGPNPGDVDYQPASGTVSFPAGSSSPQTFSVVINGDTVLEGDETFFVILTNPVDGSTIQATGTITDDELVLQLTPLTQKQLEGDSGTTDMNFQVSLIDKNTGMLAGTRQFDVTFTYATVDGTATSTGLNPGDLDFIPTTGTTVTILASADPPIATFAVPIIGDMIQEVPVLEDFLVRLIASTNAGIDPNFGPIDPTTMMVIPGQVTATIQDDDPKFRVSNPVVVEGDPGDPGTPPPRQMIFTVSLSSPVLSLTTINYETVAGTATDGQDYTGITTPGTLTFDPTTDPNLDGDNNPLTQQVRVNILPDAAAEGNETFSLKLSNPSAGGIDPLLGTGVGTIIDDDPRISINDVQVVEGNSGTTDAVFTVTLSAPSPNDVTVNYATSIGSGVSLPGSGTIFENEPNDSLATAEVLNPQTFVMTANPNITNRQGVDTSTIIPHVTIAGRGDGTFDFFRFTGIAGSRVIFDIDGATFDSRLFLFNAQGTVIASNDDGFVNGSFDGMGMLTGNALDAGSSSTEDAFIEFILPSSGVFTLGVGRKDSVATPQGLLAGASNRSIETGDQYTLHVSIENFGTAASGIVNELEPNNTFATAQNVDNAGFTLASNPNINNQNNVNISTTTPHITINGTGDGSADFYSFTAAAGQIGVFDIDGASFDTILTVFRPDGTVFASNDDNPILDTGSTTSLDSFIQTTFTTAGTYRVQVTQFNAANAAVPAGATYRLNMAIGGHALGIGGSTGGPAVADGTANPNSDFVPASMGMLTIAAGSTTGEIRVPIIGDSINEFDETFFVRLLSAVGGVIDDGTGKGTIINDDAPIISVIDPPPTPEADALGNRNVITFTIVLSRPADLPTTIDFTTVDGTAIAGLDYIPVSGSVANGNPLTFQVGEQAKTISVQLIKDGQLNEGTETFTIQLSNPQGAAFGDSDGLGTIIDNTGRVERVLAVTAPDAGAPGIVKVFDSKDGSVRFQFEPYPGFLGGVRVAVGDINNDGTPDIVTAPGPGTSPLIKVFSGLDGSLLTQFMAYDPGFLGGVFVATGDFAEGVFTQGDSFDDIIVAPDFGGGPHVRVFSSATGPTNNRQFEPTNIQNRLLFNFMAYNPLFFGGVRVAAGDVTGDGTDDLVVAAGPGGGPHVQVFDGVTRSISPVRSFFAYDPRFLGGVYVAVADVDINSPVAGRSAEIITGAGRGGGPHVRVFNVFSSPVVVSEFFAYSSNFFGGVRVAAGDINNDTILDIVTSPGPGGGPHVLAFNGQTVPGANVAAPPSALASFFAYDPTFAGGVFVAGVLDVDFGQPLLAAESHVADADTPALTQQDLDAAVQAALDRLRAAGVSEQELSDLSQVYLTVGDLGGDLLGLSSTSSIVFDVDAAGNGWFIDPTPDLDEEFLPGTNGLTAVDASAMGRIDLLTVVLHELGHKLGLDDLHSQLHPDALMNDTLPTGTRRLPSSDEMDEAFTDEGLFDSLLLN